MHDHFEELYEWDANGVPRKKKRTAHDGEHITFATISDHAAYGFSPTFADGTPDHTSPHAPGYRFSDVDDPARLAAQRSYDERNRRLETAWKRKGEQPQADARDATPRTPSLDELQKASDDAYRAKVARLDYRSRRHAT